MPILINGQSARADPRIQIGHRAGPVTAQDGCYAKQEQMLAEGFGDVIIGAKGEADDLILLLRLG